MDNLLNWAIMYSYSWWGYAYNPLYWAEVYQIPYYTSELRRRETKNKKNIMTSLYLTELKNCNG